MEPLILLSLPRTARPPAPLHYTTLRPPATPKPLDVDGDRADNWKIWKQRWDNYYITTSVLDQRDDYKCAMLLHSIGVEVMRIFNGLKFSDGEYRNSMADIIKKYMIDNM